MRQKDIDEYWELMKTVSKNLEEKYQRRIAFILCEIVEDDLDKLGIDSLNTIKELSLGKVYSKKCKSYQKKLQKNLSPDNSPSFYSPLIWGLEENSSSYPTWYSAAIAGSNIVDLKKATYQDLTHIVRKYISSL